MKRKPLNHKHLQKPAIISSRPAPPLTGRRNSHLTLSAVTRQKRVTKAVLVRPRVREPRRGENRLSKVSRRPPPRVQLSPSSAGRRLRPPTAATPTPTARPSRGLASPRRSPPPAAISPVADPVADKRLEWGRGGSGGYLAPFSFASRPGLVLRQLLPAQLLSWRGHLLSASVKVARQGACACE